AARGPAAPPRPAPAPPTPTATFTPPPTPTPTPTCSVPASECVVAPSRIISWWPAEGNGNDVVGSNNGTLIGGVTFAAGVVGQAFSFNGSDYVEVAASPSLNVPQITVEGWIKATVAGSGTVPRISSWAADRFEIGDYFNQGTLGVW